MGIVVRDGLGALTMQAIAAEVGAAVGTIYGYFPSKSALLVELQMVAIERIIDAWRDVEPRWRAELAERGLTPEETTAGMLAAFAEFFMELERVYPQEFRLQQLQVTETHEIFDAGEVDRLLPSAIGMFQVPYELVAEGMGAGVLDDADPPAARALAMVLALNGVGYTHNIQVLSSIVAVPEMVRMVLRALLVGWGAPRLVVEVGARHAAEIAASIPLCAPDLSDPAE